MSKLSLLIVLFLGYFAAQGQEIILSQTSGEWTPHGIACGDEANGITSDNYYFRLYNLSEYELSGSEVMLTGVQFGKAALSGAYTFNFAIYDAPDFPNAYNLNNLPEPIASGEVQTSAQNNPENTISVQGEFDQPVIVNTSQEIVVMYSFAGSETVRFYPGSQENETNPSYIATIECEIETPTPFSTINFPDSKITLNLVTSADLSTDQQDLAGISLYPNPAKDFIYINPPDNLIIQQLDLTDINGKRIQLVFENNTVDVSGLNPGIYFIKINTDKGQLNQKVIIKP